MSKDQITERTIKSLARHPYLWALGLCLFAEPLIDGTRLQYKGVWVFGAGTAVLILLYYFSDMKRFRQQINSAMLIGIGFTVKLAYVMNTSIYVRQHDVRSFGGDSGHCGYIEYLLFNHHLPDFDIRERWQFCHPPLHHAISAVWIYINENILGAGHDTARESLQTLTLFYSMCIMITAYKLLRYFGLNGKALFIPLLIINFHPSFIILSGSINNDVLSVALIMGAVLSALNWYRDRKMSSIIKTALCIGLGMMTKVSAAIIAPPTALLFLIVFIKHFKGEWKKLLCQFMIFGVICLPLGLWFGVRNYIKWEIPLTYVQKMEKTELQYIGDQSFSDRVTDYSPKQLDSVYLQWAWKDDDGNTQGYNEYNPMIAAMKTSVFGEFVNEQSFENAPYLNFAAKILFWDNVLIAAAALVCMIAFLFIRSDADSAQKLFLVSFWLAMMLSFYKMAHDYPFTCTMNFRYITPTVMIGCLFIGFALNKLKDHGSKARYIKYIAEACVMMFSSASTLVYLTLV